MKNIRHSIISSNVKEDIKITICFLLHFIFLPTITYFTGNVTTFHALFLLVFCSLVTYKTMKLITLEQIVKTNFFMFHSFYSCLSISEENPYKPTYVFPEDNSESEREGRSFLLLPFSPLIFCEWIYFVIQLFYAW